MADHLRSDDAVDRRRRGKDRRTGEASGELRTEAFGGVQCLVSPQPVTSRIIVERRLAVLGLSDRFDDVNTLVRVHTSVGLEQRSRRNGRRTPGCRRSYSRSAVTSLYPVRGDGFTDPSDIQAMFDNTPVNEKKLYWIEGTTARWDGHMEFQRRAQPMLDWVAQYL